jgi:hypothetical protein
MAIYAGFAALDTSSQSHTCEAIDLLSITNCAASVDLQSCGLIEIGAPSL